MEIIKEGLHVYAMECYEENSYFMNIEYPMIKENMPATLLPLQMKEQDGVNRIYYEITGRSPLTKWGKNRVLCYEDCSLLMHSFSILFQNLEDYMLSLNQVSFKKEDIYVDTEGYLHWIYKPVEDEKMKESVEDLFLWLLSIIDYQDEKAISFIYKLFHQIRKNGMTPVLFEPLSKRSKDMWQQKEDFKSIDRGYVSESPVGAYGTYELRQDMDYEDYKIEEGETGRKEKKAKKRKKDRLVQGDKIGQKDKRGIVRFCHMILLIVTLFLDFSWLIYQGIQIYVGGVTYQLIAGTIVAIALAIFIIYKHMSHDTPRKSDASEALLSDIDSSDVDQSMYDDQSYEEFDDIWGDGKHDKKYVSIFEELEEHWEKGDETVLLSESSNVKKVFLQAVEDTDYKIELQVFPFYIGSEDGLNQLCLKNKTVSRQHAVITKGGENIFYIEDLNSKNGTKVEQRLILPERPVQLNDGNRITFADETWMIHLCRDNDIDRR